MKAISKVLLILLPVFFIWTQTAAYNQPTADQPYLTKEFRTSGPGNLHVQTSGGGIAVSAHQSNTVRVEMFVRKDNRLLAPNDAAAKELLENYTINVSQSGATVSAIAERKSRNWFSGNENASISFTVYVPESISCKLQTSGGSISLKGVRGKQDVNTSGGGLNLVQIAGDMRARTSGGGIKIQNYAGILDAHTSGGPIELAEAKGELKVHTSGGGIKLKNVEGSVEASTSGGSIQADLVTLGKFVKLSTSGGSINAILPSGLGMDLDLKGQRVNTRLSNFNGQAEKDRIKGSMNGGGIPVVMATSGGSVNVEYR